MYAREQWKVGNAFIRCFISEDVLLWSVFSNSPKDIEGREGDQHKPLNTDQTNALMSYSAVTNYLNFA